VDSKIIDWSAGPRTRRRVNNRVATPQEFWADPLKEEFYYPHRYTRFEIIVKPKPTAKIG
jgi:hypothetical protein